MIEFFTIIFSDLRCISNHGHCSQLHHVLVYDRQFSSNDDYCWSSERCWLHGRHHLKTYPGILHEDWFLFLDWLFSLFHVNFINLLDCQTLGFVLLGGVEVHALNVSGLVINTAGGVWYSYAKYQEKKRKLPKTPLHDVKITVFGS